MKLGILKAQILFSTPMVALNAFVLVAAVGVTTTGFAAEYGSLASSEYRLSVEKPDAFRLTATELDVLAPEPRKESAAAPRLADRPFAKLIDGAAREAALDPALVHAVISVESAYNSGARSPKGAIGLMQVLPETASRYGVRNAALSPAANLRAGTRYLSDLMELFDNRVDLVLAAYNAGENAVLRYGHRIPPYRETQQYVPAALARYLEWREPLPAAAPAPVRIQYMPGTGLDFDFLHATGHR
jgi:soluble lytic murein transglycosylase-like protein